MILSAFPRNMRLPDPYSPNLKIDNIAESSQAPRILSDYMNPLSGIRTHLDNYMTHKQPVELPSKLPAILTNSVGGNYNTALITSLVVYIGSMAIVQIQSNKATLNTSPAMDIYKQMSISLDAEGRYIVLNTMANQLRYPNSHTNFFSFVLLNLFMDTDNEFIQEQITRVLLERLIVHRPHPVSYSYIIHYTLCCNNVLLMFLQCFLYSMI
jgi:CCR4-NOT transcription complex subunit 1